MPLYLLHTEVHFLLAFLNLIVRSQKVRKCRKKAGVCWCLISPVVPLCEDAHIEYKWEECTKLEALGSLGTQSDLQSGFLGERRDLCIKGTLHRGGKCKQSTPKGRGAE
jgi:hypothetical protein